MRIKINTVEILKKENIIKSSRIIRIEILSFWKCLKGWFNFNIVIIVQKYLVIFTNPQFETDIKNRIISQEWNEEALWEINWTKFFIQYEFNQNIL